MSEPENSRLATDRQKEYARQLGITFSDQITRAEISNLIDDAVIRRDEKRYQELDELQQRESEAWENMRAEVLEDIDADPEQCRLSTADTSKIMEELFRRGLAAVLITVPWDDFDPDDLAGVSFTMSFCDDMPLNEAERMIKSTALTFWKRDGIDLLAAMENSTALLEKSFVAIENANKLVQRSGGENKASKGR